MKGKRRISREGRRRMAEAGIRNLERWKAGESSRVNALQADIAAYREALLRDVGANLTATKAGLVEGAVATYASIVIVRSKLVDGRSRKPSVVATLSERISWLVSNLIRLLKQLNLDAKPRPRSLAEVFARKAAESPANPGQSATNAVESRGEPA